MEELEGALGFVADALKGEENRVLLHCGQGQSRSGAVAAALLMVRCVVLCVL